MHIGLFDSGIGGLTVLRELRRQFPKARYTYLGDTARLPYGNKAPETLQKYTQENIEFLDNQGVDCIVIACHSASTVALDLQQSFKGTPIFNMITPSASMAQKISKNQKVGVMATKATVRSMVYPALFKSLDSKFEVFSQECPLLVPLVEEDLIQDELTEFILKRYLVPLKAKAPDTVILGCTHYPILKNEIAAILGSEIQLIDPAVAVAEELKSLVTPEPSSARLEIYLTDHSPHFIAQAESLLGELKDVAFLFPES